MYQTSELLGIRSQPHGQTVGILLRSRQDAQLPVLQLKILQPPRMTDIIVAEISGIVSAHPKHALRFPYPLGLQVQRLWDLDGDMLSSSWT